VSNDVIDHLKSLHTGAVDARHGYEEALSDAEGRGMTPLFREMIALHEHNAAELASLLKAAGVQSNDDGSFMSTVHRTIMSVRGLFGGLGESVVPGLIDGEKRNIASYDDALKIDGLPADTRQLLTRQRERLQAAIATMQAPVH
jgi:uncharacterized protein (TIGR02284 family)